MNWQMLKVGACAGTMMMGLMLLHGSGIMATKLNLSLASSAVKSKELSRIELCERAQKITVRVFNGDYWGSGILVKRHGNRYTVVTNGHVVAPDAERVIVEDFNGRRNEAFVLVRFDHNKLGDDLTILQFNSPVAYETATLAEVSENDQVMAAGFPLYPDLVPNRENFVCTELGQVSRNLEEPMQNGYQLGYFLPVYKGMSGGPLFNAKGKVVGINGMSQPAIVANPDIYLYKNGRRVSESLELPVDEALELLYNSSWAIPSKKLVYLAPCVLKLDLD